MLTVNLCLGIFLICICTETISQNTNTSFQFSIVHFNDFHARFEPSNPSGGSCKNPSECIGGFTRMYKQIITMLKDNPKSILLNAGDSFQGTLWYTIGRWNVTQEFMNKLPIDAETIGNHEFDNGIQGLVPYIKALKHPIVVSNIDDTLEPDFQGIYNKSIIIERDGKKIGIIGVVSTEYPILCNSEKLKFFDESTSINEEAERLVREEGVFTNIILSHCGYQTDKILAANAYEKISLIVGAHSHTFLWTGENPPGPAEVEGPYPTIVESKYGHKVLITQASAYCRYLGNITINLDENGKILDYSGAPIFLDSNYPEDEEINTALRPWKDLIDLQGLETVGSSLVTMSNIGCYYRECTLGNFVTDAMVYAYTNITSNVAWTGAAVAFINAGGLRTNLYSGDLSFNDLVTSNPFENSFDFGILTGKDLKDLFEFGVDGYTVDDPKGNLRLLQVSGVKLVYDLSRDLGDRVISVKIRCQNCTIPVYEELDLNKDYNIVVCSFLLTGGGGFFIIRDRMRNIKVGRKDIDVLVEYVSNKSPLFQEEYGRIIFK